MHANPLGAARARAVVLGILVLVAVGLLPAAAQEPDDITLRLGATTGNPGDTVEVTVDLVAGDAVPEAFALFIAHDPAALEPLPEAYEIVARDEFTGEPILDGDGNTIADFTMVRLADAVRDAGKMASFEIFEEEGAVGVLVHGINQNPIPEGRLLTLAFRIRESVPDGSMTDVLGLDTESTIFVPDGDGGVSRLESSFTRTVTEDGESRVELLSYGFEDTAVIVGCIPPAAPGGVTATQGQGDSVAVSWNAVAGESIEYRVLRSRTSDPATATPIGAAWQAGTSFSDITARVPEVIPGECFMPEQVNEVRYFYWVRARSMEGCESELSSPPAEGYRGRAGNAGKQAAAALLPGPAGSGRLLVYTVLAAALALLGFRARRPRRSNAT